jgi:la-related protein 1
LWALVETFANLPSEYYFSVDNLLKDMYLRRHMDSQGFVSLDFIGSFNRIKNLTTDVELLKLVCQQSANVQYRTGEDGRDRLRRREGWEQWVLTMADRDESAQNEGPKELHNPPVPNPAGFDQSNLPQYPTMQAGYGNDVTYPQQIPFVPAAAAPAEELANGTTPEGANGTAVPNGQPIEESTKAVSAEPDSFSDAQLECLTVIVRMQHDSLPVLRRSTSRTFSNGSLDSKSSAANELDGVISPSETDGVVAPHK